MSKGSANRDKAKQSRADRFWGAFLFTENGKPKSSLMVYTFCLSFVFALVYALAYEGAVRLLTAPLEGAAVWASNLIIALSASVLGALICCAPHRFLKDKRLVFGGHLWLLLYAVLVLVTMLILLRGEDASGAFLTFFGWFIALPVALGCVLSGILFRRDWHPDTPKDEEPEWKKYVNRR